MGAPRRLSGAAALAFALTVGACSSSRHASPATTARPDRTPNSVKAFFASQGAPLLAFERATAALVTGSRPPRSTCEQLVRDAVPKTTDAQRACSQLVAKIPDASLRDGFTTDVNNRNFLLRACVSPTGLTDDPAEQRVFAAYRDHARALVTALARAGVAP